MRHVWFALLWMACDLRVGTPDSPDDPKGWTLSVDVTGLERFAPGDATSWPIAGTVFATEGLATVDVAALPAQLAGDAFTATAPIGRGLTRVSILARDLAGHERKADRSVIAARYLAAGDHNPDAASLVLDDAILAGLADDVTAETGAIDVAGEILARPILSQDDRCVTWPVSASQGEVSVRLVEDRGDLWLRIRIPDLYVYFEGSCQGLISTIPIGGEMTGTIDVWTQISGRPPADESACLTAFAHTRPEVEIAGWGFGVWGLGGPLQNWIVNLFAGEKSAEARSTRARRRGGPRYKQRR